MLSRFYTKSTTLIVINLITISVYFLAQPVLREIYSPEDFGFYDLIIKTATIFSAILSLKLEKLLPSETRINTFYNIVFGVILLLFSSILLLTILVKKTLPKTLVIDNIWLILLVAVLLAFNQALKLIAVDNSKTVKFGLSAFLKRLLEITTNLTITKYGLILGEVVGNITSIFYLSPPRIKISLRKTISYLSDHRENVFYNFLPEILITISTAFPTLLIYYKFSLESAGLYEMTDKFIYLPLVLLANPIGIMILDFFSKNSLGEKNKVFYKVLIINFLASLFIGLLIYFSIEYIINTFFGSQWFEVVEMVKTLIPFLVLRVFVAPFGQVLVARRFLKMFSIIQVIRLLLLLSLSIPDYENLSQFIKYLTVSQSGFYIFMLTVIILTLNRNEGSSHMQ